MSLAIVFSRAMLGVDAPLVTVEAHLANGLPAFNIVGLPEATVKEARERVRSALINAHFEFPARRITINLAPADLPKEGGRFDLAIALAILVASEQLPKTRIHHYEFIGELALSGELRGVSGVLSAAIASHHSQRQLICANDNAQEAAIGQNGTAKAARHLLEICAYLRGENVELNVSEQVAQAPKPQLDMQDVQGQKIAKRALEIAAAGQHNILMIGSPGAGKTMLAERLPSILPAMTHKQALEHSKLYSAAGDWQANTWYTRPFRSPHHTASSAAIVGGGSKPKPGEISLAHHGVLFMDEFPEFSRPVLEALREPLEKGEIAITRANQKVHYPAQFQLVAAMNPCPCGYLNDKRRECGCTPTVISRYQQKLSGPLLDRIDMHIYVHATDSQSLLQQNNKEESSEMIQQRVVAAYEKQLARGQLNKTLSSKALQHYCEIDNVMMEHVIALFDQLKLSVRAMTRVLRLSRTIADLADSATVSMAHIGEAISYRALDRQ